MNEERSLQKSLKDKNSVFQLYGDARRVATCPDALKLPWPKGWPQFFLEPVHVLIFYYLTK